MSIQGVQALHRTESVYSADKMIPLINSMATHINRTSPNFIPIIYSYDLSK